MTTTATDLDFLMTSTDANGEDMPVETLPVESAKDDAKVQAAAANKAAIDDIVNVLIPPQESEAKEKSTPKEESKAETKTETTVQPIIHDPQLLRLAGSWGIGPDDAARYLTEEALLGAVALREIRFRNSESAMRQSPEMRKMELPKDELPIPEIKLDDDTDPAIKAAVTSLVDYTQKLKSWTAAKMTAQEMEIQRLTSEHGQAAEDRRLESEAKNARMFDEKVATWGDEFKELLGVPTKTWQQPGTTQNAELLKLHSKVRQLAAGFGALSGRDPTPDELGGFIDEARYAIWPDRIKTAVRNEISNSARKQRGGVGMRPGKSRTNEPPEQGDFAAKAAIGDFMAEHGLDPWARRSAT